MSINRRNDWDHEDEGTWAISYGDMITLLLSFFVIYFSFDFKEAKEDKLEQEIISAINDLSTVESDSEQVSLKSTQANPDNLFTDNDYFIEKVSPGQFIVIFRDTSFFRSGSLRISPRAQGKLEKFASTYLPFAGKYSIKVKAFTDNTPVVPKKEVKRAYSDNLELSTLRSLSVMRFLTKKGIPMRRIEISGTGVISKNFEQYLGIHLKEDNLKRALSRTVALVIKRDEDQG